jgi:hypothetical protein
MSKRRIIEHFLSLFGRAYNNHYHFLFRAQGSKIAGLSPTFRQSRRRIVSAATLLRNNTAIVLHGEG